MCCSDTVAVSMIMSFHQRLTGCQFATTYGNDNVRVKADLRDPINLAKHNTVSIILHTAHSRFGTV